MSVDIFYEWTLRLFLRLLLTSILGCLEGAFQPLLDVAELPLRPPRIIHSVPSVVLLADRNVHLSQPARGPLISSRTRARNDCGCIGCSVHCPPPCLESRCLPNVPADLVSSARFLCVVLVPLFHQAYGVPWDGAPSAIVLAGVNASYHLLSPISRCGHLSFRGLRPKFYHDELGTGVATRRRTRGPLWALFPLRIT